MKIAILSDTDINFDGRVRRITRSFAGKGYQVSLFVPRSKGLNLKTFDEPNIELIQYDMNRSKLNNNLFFWKKFIPVVQVVLNQKKKYDLVYVNDYPLLKSGVILKKELNCTLLYDMHEIYAETINQFFPMTGIKGVTLGRGLIAVNRILHTCLEKRWIKNADHVITVCESFKDYFKKAYHIDANVLKNCPIEFQDLNKSNVFREHFSLKETDKILLYQGIFNYSRGLEKTILAADQFDDDIHFVLMGDGPLKSTLLSLAKNRSNVHFYPMMPNTSFIHYVASGDLGIMLIEPNNLSKKLTLPCKAFDYMHAQLPFVTNNLPEASQLAIKHNCGIVIEDQTPNIIAKNVNDVFKRDLRQMGERGRQAIKDHYLWSYDFDRLFEKLGDSKK